MRIYTFYSDGRKLYVVKLKKTTLKFGDPKRESIKGSNRGGK